MTTKHFLTELHERVNYLGEDLKVRIDHDTYSLTEITEADFLGEDEIELILCGWQVATISHDEIYKFNDTTLRLYGDLLATYSFTLNHDAFRR